MTIERVLAAVLAVAGLLVLSPLLPWLVLTLWVCHVIRPLHLRVRKWVRGSERGAAVLVVALTIVIIAPLVAVGVVLFRDAIALGTQLSSSKGGQQALRSLVSGNGAEEGTGLGAGQVVELIKQHGDRAWSVGWGVLGVATDIFIGMFIFLYGCFVVLVDGRRAFAWFEHHAPVRPVTLRRFAKAFNETGRGLFIGVGVTGLIQAVIATGMYLVLGVPRALVLGLLTFFASMLPTVGTALVWAPVAAGLAMTGRRGAAIALVVVGVAVVGSVDNVVRPLIAHKADEHVPAFVLMVSMFGGIVLLGGWGILIGPLLVRFAMEALTMLRASMENPDAVPESETGEDAPPPSLL